MTCPHHFNLGANQIGQLCFRVMEPGEILRWGSRHSGPRHSWQMLDKCAPRHFPPHTGRNSNALFPLISILPPLRHIASHHMLPRENVPHKLDCMLPCCSTSSATLCSPLPLTDRPLCPASVLTSLQFFRWWRFCAPWRLLLTACVERLAPG